MRFFPLIVIALLAGAFAPASGWAQDIHCKPCWYAFGKVDVGSSSSYEFVLTNTGTKILKVNSQSEQGAGFTMGNLQLPVKVQPGGSLQLPVTFQPTVQGEVHGIITLTSNDPKSPLTINVHGTGVLGGGGSQLTVSPATLNFGDVTEGQTASLQATLTASNGAVTISEDRSNSSEFKISGLKLPVTIASGKSVTAKIAFTPKSAGTADAKAGFISNATDSPAIEELTGTGVPAGSHQVDLSWQPGGDNPVGYNVFRGTTHGGPYQQINTSLDSSSSYTDSNVQGGETYYYVATEVNSQGQQSGYSNETEAQVPNN